MEDQKSKSPITVVIFLITILMLLSIRGIINPDPFLNFIFPQGDNYFHILNTETNKMEDELVSFKAIIILGSTYFTLNNIQYFGYIEAVEVNKAHFEHTFHYFQISSKSDKTSIKFAIAPAWGKILVGLTVEYLDQNPVFSTILSEGKTESAITKLLKFSLNGSLIHEIPYILTNYSWAKIIDICFLDNQRYLLLSTLYESEVAFDVADHFLIYSLDGNATNFVDIKYPSKSIAYDPYSNTIFSSNLEGESIHQWDFQGNLMRSIQLSFRPYEIDIIDQHHILVQEYKNNWTGLIITGLSLVTVILITTLIIKYRRKHRSK